MKLHLEKSKFCGSYLWTVRDVKSCLQDIHEKKCGEENRSDHDRLLFLRILLHSRGVLDHRHRYVGSSRSKHVTGKSVTNQTNGLHPSLISLRRHQQDRLRQKRECTNLVRLILTQYCCAPQHDQLLQPRKEVFHQNNDNQSEMKRSIRKDDCFLMLKRDLISIASSRRLSGEMFQLCKLKMSYRSKLLSLLQPAKDKKLNDDDHNDKTMSNDNNIDMLYFASPNLSVRKSYASCVYNQMLRLHEEDQNDSNGNNRKIAELSGHQLESFVFKLNQCAKRDARIREVQMLTLLEPLLNASRNAAHEKGQGDNNDLNTTTKTESISMNYGSWSYHALLSLTKDYDVENILSLNIPCSLLCNSIVQNSEHGFLFNTKTKCKYQNEQEHCSMNKNLLAAVATRRYSHGMISTAFFTVASRLHQTAWWFLLSPVVVNLVSNFFFPIAYEYLRCLIEIAIAAYAEVPKAMALQIGLNQNFGKHESKESRDRDHCVSDDCEHLFDECVSRISSLVKTSLHLLSFTENYISSLREETTKIKEKESLRDLGLTVDDKSEDVVPGSSSTNTDESDINEDCRKNNIYNCMKHQKYVVYVLDVLVGKIRR